MLPWLCEFASRACRVVVMGCVLRARMFSEDWIFRLSCFVLLRVLVFQECVERGPGRWAQGERCHISSRCAYSVQCTLEIGSVLLRGLVIGTPGAIG